MAYILYKLVFAFRSEFWIISCSILKSTNAQPVNPYTSKKLTTRGQLLLKYHGVEYAHGKHFFPLSQSS